MCHFLKVTKTASNYHKSASDAVFGTLRLRFLCTVDTNDSIPCGWTVYEK